MKKNLTIGDKISLFFFRFLFPKFHKEIVWVNKEYRKVQDALRVKQNTLQGLERKIRRLERGIK